MQLTSQKNSLSGLFTCCNLCSSDRFYFLLDFTFYLVVNLQTYLVRTKAKAIVMIYKKVHRQPCSKSVWGEGGTFLGRGEVVPTLARGGGTYLGQGRGYLPWPGGGVPTLARGRGTYLGRRGGTYLGQGEGVPTLARGRGIYLDQGGGTYLGQREGVPTFARGGGTHLGREGRGYLPWPGGGYLMGT